MDPATRLGRHADLWQAGSTRVERVAVAGLIFASVIYFNVIEPYAQTEQSRVNLVGLETSQQEAAIELSRIDAFATKLEGISEAVQEASWRRHKDDLEQRFSDGTVRAPQEEADQTIRDIAEEVRGEVLDPLVTAVAESGLDGTMAEHPAHMKAVIDNWEQTYLGQPWFRTVREKERTVVELGTTIEGLQEEARQVLVTLQRTVDAERRESQQAHSVLEAKIQTTRQEIQETLDEAIPAWARGLVSVERMVVVYPWILVGIAIWLVGSALVSVRHYQGMANAADWSQPERSDPLLSSIWTLTWRGIVGTAITLSCFSAVLAGFAYFLNRSIALVGSGQTPGWLLYLILSLLLMIVIATPFRWRFEDRVKDDS